MTYTVGNLRWWNLKLGMNRNSMSLRWWTLHLNASRSAVKRLFSRRYLPPPSKKRAMPCRSAFEVGMKQYG